MTTPKELYKTLSDAIWNEDDFYIVDRGEGMMMCREKTTRRICLVNKKTQEAWELLKANGRFSFWDASSVEITAALNLPYKAQRNAVELRAPYYLDIDDFKDGVAYVSWTLQPDRRYYADKLGMTVDDEIKFHAFIDSKADVIIPFQPMDRDLEERYRKQALIITEKQNEIPYVCLAQELTVPSAENRNLSLHREKLQKIIYGMMYQFASQARNAYKHPEYEGKLGILSALNPDPAHYLALTIYGSLAEGCKDTYDIHTVTALFREGEEPLGFSTPMGTYDIAQIEEIMSLEDNVAVILDDFLQSVDLIYSGNLPNP